MARAPWLSSKETPDQQRFPSKCFKKSNALSEEEVRKHRDRVTGAWKQISKQRRRVDVSYDPSMVTALQHGTWMNEEGFKKTLYQVEGKKRSHPPASLRGLHAETRCRKVYAGEFFECQTNPMEANETIGADGGRKYANSQNSDQNRQDTISRVSAFKCRIVRETRCESTDSLAAETHGHINSAGCEGMATAL